MYSLTRKPGAGPRRPKSFDTNDLRQSSKKSKLFVNPQKKPKLFVNPQKKSKQDNKIEF